MLQDALTQPGWTLYGVPEAASRTPSGDRRRAIVVSNRSGALGRVPMAYEALILRAVDILETGGSAHGLTGAMRRLNRAVTDGPLEGLDEDDVRLRARALVALARGRPLPVEFDDELRRLSTYGND